MMRSWEIVLAWTGRVPTDTHLELPEGADPDEPGFWCVAAGDDYVGTTVVLEGITWSMPWAQLMYSVIRGPDRDYHPGWSWTACALTIAMTGDTSTGPTTGSLRSVLTDPSGPRPSGWVRCGAAPGFTRSVPCTGPHRSEQVAIATLPLDGETADGADTPVTDPRVEEQCRTLVDRYLGAPSGTHADDLVAVVTSLGPSVERRDGENHAVGAVFDCLVQITGDRDLIGTVNALGTAPLPLG